MSERRITLVVALLMVLVGAIAWGFQLRSAPRVDPNSLADLPEQLQGWRSRDIPMEPAVETMLRADFNVQRAFLHPMGEVVWLYVGYYGTERGGTPEHTPAACYRAHGWHLSNLHTRLLDPERGLRVNEAEVELEGRRRLVMFWFRSYRATGILDGLGLGIDHLFGRLLDGRADGALVRVSTPLEAESELTARSRLSSFARLIDSELDRYWPSEVPLR